MHIILSNLSSSVVSMHTLISVKVIIEQIRNFLRMINEGVLRLVILKKLSVAPTDQQHMRSYWFTPRSDYAEVCCCGCVQDRGDVVSLYCVG